MWLLNLIRTALFPKDKTLFRSRQAHKRRTYIPEILETRTLLSAFSISSAGNDTATAVVADPAGNFYVTGSFTGTTDFDPSSSVVNLTSGGGSAVDSFLAKYDKTGALIWAKALVDTTTSGLTMDSAGSVYVAETKSGTASTAVLAKYDSNGTALLQATFGGGTTLGVVGDFVAIDGSGNLYLSGVMSRGTADFDPGAGTFNLTNSSGNADTFIVKLNSLGNFVWADKFTNDPTISAGVWPEGLGLGTSYHLLNSNSPIHHVLQV